MFLQRTELLIGSDNIEKLKNSSVIVFGLGGVGGATVEALVRAGIECCLLFRFRYSLFRNFGSKKI